MAMQKSAVPRSTGVAGRALLFLLQDLFCWAIWQKNAANNPVTKKLSASLCIACFIAGYTIARKNQSPRSHKLSD